MNEKNLLAIILFFLYVSDSNAQTKKEQIIILTSRIDSLFQVVDSKNTIIDESIKTIKNLENKINENNIIETKLQNDVLLSKLKYDSILNLLDSNTNKLETQLKNNKILSLQINELKNFNLKYDCREALGNSSSNYPYRISGVMNGCIGESCEVVPSDLELHAAILKISKDFNNDGIINVKDLESAIKEIGDINDDGKKDIYDLNYPNKIKYTKNIINPQVIKDDDITSYNLSGNISEDGTKIILSKPIYIIYPNLGDGNEEYLRVERKEIYISVGAEISLYKNKNIVVKGKLYSGNVKSYTDGFVFFIEEILGAIK